MSDKGTLVSLGQLLDQKLEPVLSSIEEIREIAKDLLKLTSFLSEKFLTKRS